MARLMPPEAVLTLLRESWESHRRQRKAAERVDLWYRGKQQDVDEGSMSGKPFMPAGRASTSEYLDLGSRSPTPWANVLVESLAQQCSLDGIYLPGKNEPLSSWKLWQENRYDGHQSALYRACFAHGFAFTSALPATSLWTGERTARFTSYDAKTMSAYYAEPHDEFPLWTIEAIEQTDDKGERFWDVRLTDEVAVHHCQVKGDGVDKKDFEYVSPELVHDLGFTPVVQYTNTKELDGSIRGEIEPFIPILRRLDQDVFDRLVVQRFGAWVVRYGTGLVEPGTDEDKRAQKILLSMGEMLMSEEATSKFGTLAPTEIKGFIEAHAADLQMLSAVSQRPHHHLAGAGSNLPPESMSIVEQGLMRRVHDRRTGFGEQHELLFRTGAVILGNTEEARSFDMQVRWRDTEARSFAQTMDALGKAATLLQVPVEMLWERIPNWTDSDTERAKNMRMLEGLTALLNEVENQNPAPTQPGVPGSQGLQV